MKKVYVLKIWVIILFLLTALFWGTKQSSAQILPPQNPDHPDYYYLYITGQLDKYGLDYSDFDFFNPYSYYNQVYNNPYSDLRFPLPPGVWYEEINSPSRYQQPYYGYQQPFNFIGTPYGNGFGFSPFGYQQSYNPYFNMGGYWQPSSYNWFNPWQQQPYQNYNVGPSYLPYGYSRNPFTPQFPYYSGGFNPVQPWPFTDNCSSGGTSYDVWKPAIYLYPEEDTHVKVSLDINGTFTETIPPYNSGWEVSATKEGKTFTTDLKDSFDYLFWEAQMNNLTIPDKGWVVAQENIRDWFHNNLSRFGLNKREQADFMDFWLDKLTDAGYYEIKLLDQSLWESDAKLTVSPSPDTVIRVIFYFTPLDEYKIMEAPVIKTPERKGFVVLEWGGIIGE